MNGGKLDVPFCFTTSAILELADRVEKLEAAPRIDERALRTEAQTNPKLIEGWVNLYAFQELDRRRHNFDGASARFEGGSTSPKI